MLPRHRLRQAIHDNARIGKKGDPLPAMWTQGSQILRNEAGMSMKTNEGLEEIARVERIVWKTNNLYVKCRNTVEKK